VLNLLNGIHKNLRQVFFSFFLTVPTLDLLADCLELILIAYGKIKSSGEGFTPGVKQKLPRKYSGKIKQVIPPSDRVLYFGERSIIFPPND